MKNLIFVLAVLCALSSLQFSCCGGNNKPKEEKTVEKIGIVRNVSFNSNSGYYTIVFESNSGGLESFGYCSSCGGGIAPPVWPDLKCRIILSDELNPGVYKSIKVTKTGE